MPQPCSVCNRTGVPVYPHPSGRPLGVVECPACGTYARSHESQFITKTLTDDERFALAAATRQASDAGRPLELLESNVRSIIAGAPRTPTLSDGIDRLLLLLGQRGRSYLAPISVNKDNDYPLVFARGPEGMNELLVIAMKLGLLDDRPSEIRLTLKGWERFDSLRASQPDSRQAFVAMWFAPDLEEAWVQGFKEGIERSKYFRAMRIDTIEHNQKIDDRIVAEIRRSGLLVADFTGHRGGVYFEAGYAKGLGVPVIWTCREDEKELLHFDTRQYNHIIWINPGDLADQLHDRISATVMPRGWTG